MADIIGSGNKKDKWTKKVTDWINWLNEKKQATLVAGDNVTLTPQQDGTVQIDAGGGAVALDDLTDVDVSSVTDGQALVYDATNQEWIAGEAGQVDDVKVNGTSVVSNKIAEITSYKEVTQDEYDALSEAQKMNGVAYFIKDAMLPSRSNIYAPVIYSTNERMVGVYIDGKPLYQKTLVATSTDTTGTDVNIDMASFNIDTCVDITGTFDRITGGGNKRIYMFNAYESSEYWSFVRYMATEKMITFKIAMSIGQSTTKQTFTIRYTKTTDVAGSGNWGADGIPMHHYDNVERIIGTWTSGETLYEKTVTIPYSGASRRTNYVLFGIRTGDFPNPQYQLKSITGYVGSSSNGMIPIGGRNYRSENNSIVVDKYVECLVYYNDVILYDSQGLADLDNVVAPSSLFATVRYTKAT